MTQLPRPASQPPEQADTLAVDDRPTVVEVDTAALAHNLREIRRLVGARVKILAVVKADGYGHGAVPSARTFVGAGADWLGVALIEEGAELRRAGLAVPICILSGLSGNDASALVAHRLTPIVYRPDQLAVVAAAARAQGVSRYPVHFKIDTGMGRFGALPGEVGTFLDALAAHPELELEGLATHFANADSADDAAMARQLETFRAVEATVSMRGLTPRLRHVANSASVLVYPDTHGDLVRPGLALYGHAPTPAMAVGVSLRPALTLRTRVTHLKELPAESPVSYGGTFRTARRTRVASLPIGYADGLPRLVSNRAAVLVRGIRAPLIGRVCMDVVLADVTDVPGAALYDDVVLIGRQGSEVLSAEELAGHADSINYEILCGIGKRVPRIYR